MNETVSCCGVICSQCAYLGQDCPGCSETHGHPFWLNYTGEPICDIYTCCVLDKKLAHCGKCPGLPCSFYEQDDPTKTPEENAEDHRKQLEQLLRMS